MARQLKPFGLDIIAFTQYEEGVAYQGGPPTGADWEFVFDSRSRCFRMRVQAKRMYLNNYTYRSLGPLPASAQHQALITNANGALPTYIFYNSDVPVQRNLARNIKDELQLKRAQWKTMPGCQSPHFQPPTYWGCAIRSAQATPYGNNFVANDMAPMMPLHCLFCTCRGKSDLVDRVHSALAEYRTKLTVELGSEQEFDLPEVEKLPDWLRRLTLDQMEEDERKSELKERRLSGVAVISQRQGIKQ